MTRTATIWAEDTGIVPFEVADDATDAQELEAGLAAQAAARAQA